MSRQFLRCFELAERKRGNHSSGADTCRPSASATTSESSVNVTFTASATGLAVVVFIPSQYKLFAIFFNHFTQRRQLMAAERARLGQFLHRFEPELRVFLRSLHVDVRRLMPFAAEKEKPKPARSH